MGAEREGLRRGVDLAEGWAGRHPGLHRCPDLISGVDPGLFPEEKPCTALGGRGWSPEISERAWLDPRLLYESAPRSRKRTWGDTQEASRCYKHSLHSTPNPKCFVWQIL